MAAPSAQGLRTARFSAARFEIYHKQRLPGSFPSCGQPTPAYAGETPHTGLDALCFVQI